MPFQGLKPVPRAGTIGFGDIHCSRLPQDEQVADAILFIQRLGSESFATGTP